MLNKRYRPLPHQLRDSAHHFADQVIHMLTGEPGICLTRVAFSRGKGDRRDLYVVDYDGENLMRLTANRTLNLCPGWSPDGTRDRLHQLPGQPPGAVRPGYGQRPGRPDHLPAGAQLRGGLASLGRGTAALHVARGQSGDLPGQSGGGDPPAVDRLAGHRDRPELVPGGRDLVFTSDRTGTPQLYIIDGEGAGRRRLTFEGRYNESAVWSPAGDRIAYATRIGDFTQVVVINVTGENRRVLTDRGWRNAEDPSWAPDGRHLVFASDREGAFNLYVCDVEEGTFRQLTPGSIRISHRPGPARGRPGRAHSQGAVWHVPRWEEFQVHGGPRVSSSASAWCSPAVAAATRKWKPTRPPAVTPMRWKMSRSR